MSPSDHNVDTEAQMDVEERRVELEDTAEKQRGDNTKTQSSGMSTLCLTTPSPHLSSSRELW